MTSENQIVTPATGFLNLSPYAFHRFARHYYKASEDFVSPDPGFSPVPYFLLSRAIELELKSRHLVEARQPEIKDKYGHNLSKAYEALPDEQRILADEEVDVLNIASAKYISTDLAYFNPADALRAFKTFPDLVVLAEIAMKLIETSPVETEENSP